MNAREELFDAALHSSATSSEDPDREARRLLDNYRAEVLRKAADGIALDRDATIPGGGRGAYRRGMTRAVDLLRGMAGGEPR